MLFPTAALAASLWASTTLSQPSNPSSRPFHLHTQLKPDQPGKDRFDNLWLYAYHTGAGLNDAMLSGNKTHAIAGFLTASNITTTPGGDALYGVGFDLGGDTGLSWGLGPQIGVNTYAAWQPVRIDAGGAAAGEYSAFFVDGDGLQWTTSATGIPDSFGGWFVCNWWHGDIDGAGAGPQLFFRVNGFGHIALETCADVFLVPEYI